ncbi:hypothetical protein LSAT2_027051 [Lamellibrachia satsuma]|nr:hypothetical protein LSAT2_027051 [Lamellibrachia satsuma]
MLTPYIPHQGHADMVPRVRGSIDECPASLPGAGGKTVEGTLPAEKPHRQLLSKTASSAEVIAAMMDNT